MHRINREGRNDMKSIRIDLFTNLSIFRLFVYLFIYVHYLPSIKQLAIVSQPSNHSITPSITKPVLGASKDVGQKLCLS